MRRYFTIFFSLLVINVYSSNVIRQAKDALKKKQNLEQTAKNLLAEADKESTKHNDKITCYVMAAECSYKLYEAQNLKLYLKQKYDTTAFFANQLMTFERLMKADSLEEWPDERGRVRIKNRKRSHDLLLPLRGNILNGGKWYFRKNDMKSAFLYLDKYVRIASNPIFLKDSLLQKDTLMAPTAYLSVIAANRINDTDGVIRNAPLAKKAGMKSHLIQEYLCKAYAERKDSMQWFTSLYDGVKDYPLHDFFYSHLVDYYISKNEYEQALALTDSLLQTADSIPLFWYGRSMILLKQERDREAIDACDSCLKYSPNHVDALYNKGIASLNLAILYAEQACTDLTNPQCRRDQEIIRSLYLLAKLPMERVRELIPDKPHRWAQPLYRIYLHLNMGKEFDEIDKILNSSSR